MTVRSRYFPQNLSFDLLWNWESRVFLVDAHNQIRISKHGELSSVAENLKFLLCMASIIFSYLDVVHTKDIGNNKDYQMVQHSFARSRSADSLLACRLLISGQL